MNSNKTKKNNANDLMSKNKNEEKHCDFWYENAVVITCTNSFTCIDITWANRSICANITCKSRFNGTYITCTNIFTEIYITWANRIICKNITWRKTFTWTNSFNWTKNYMDERIYSDKTCLVKQVYWNKHYLDKRAFLEWIYYFHVYITSIYYFHVWIYLDKHYFN